jgi:uncharacterized caspase-like protein
MVRYACALIACLVLVTAGHAAERRVALVIGNSAYKQAPLLNPGNDARAMAQVLRESGFAVKELRNLNQAGMRRAIREFGDDIAKGGVGLFFFAGHGMQIRGRNFLIPVGSDIEREDEVEDQAVDARLVLEKMASAKNALNIVILDACRNNPFISSFRSSIVGLAAMDAPAGTLVAFSTAPGQVAADGTGDNGLYTQHLVSYMREPGLKVEDVFKRVRSAVRQESGGRQTPWENTSLEADFYFKARDPRAVAEEKREREQAQKEAIEKAVQDALKRSGQQAARDRAGIEREIAERVAAERAVAEKAAAARIATMEKALQNALSRPAAAAAPEALAGGVSGGGDGRRRQAPEPTQVAVSAPRSAAMSGGGGVAPKSGDNWVYKLTDRDYSVVRERKYTFRVESVTDTSIQVRTGSKTWFRYTRDWNLVAYTPGDGIERKFDPPIPIFSFPLEPGKTWQGKYTTARRDGQVFDNDRSVTVEGWEKVTVPAGTFKALKVSSLTYYRRVDGKGSGGGRIVFNYWYVPEVGRPVRIEDVNIGNNGVVHQDFTSELVSYKLH